MYAKAMSGARMSEIICRRKLAYGRQMISGVSIGSIKICYILDKEDINGYRK